MIKIICVGKIKEKYLTDLIEDYKKRITKYHKIEIIELNDENNLSKEKLNISKQLKSTDYIIALDINGITLDSESFAKKLDNLFINNSNIVFIIGSSLGLDEKILQRANMLLSFSRFTFPHGLFRGILLEQIYRSFKIINNETYHK